MASSSSWEHESNHLGSGITNHLDTFFDVERPPVHSAELGPHELLPHPQPFAVGNVLDLNAGEAAEDYNGGGGGGGGSIYADGTTYRPVPGTKAVLMFLQSTHTLATLCFGFLSFFVVFLLFRTLHLSFFFFVCKYR